MKDMRIYMSVMAAGLFGALLAGCTKTEEIYIDEMYQKAYITADLYPQSEGRFSIADQLSDPFFGVQNNRLVYTSGMVSTVTGKDSYELFFRTLYPVKKDLQAKLIAADEAAVEAFNAENGLSGEDAYKLLPADCYTVDNNVSTIETGHKEGDKTFAVTFSENVANIAEGQYLLPLTCSLDDPDIALSSSMGVFYLMVNHTFEDLRTGEGDDVPQNIRILYKDTDFSYAVTKGSFFYSTGAYSVDCLFDNDLSSGSIAATGEDNTEVTVTFNEAQPLDRIGIALYDPWGYSYSYSNYFWISWVYEGETEVHELGDWIETAPQNEAYIYWLDAASLMGTDKKVAKVMIMVYDAYSYLSEFYLISSED